MQLIQSPQGLTRACDQPVDAELCTILGGYAAALQEFGDDLLAEILIVEATDTLAEAEGAYCARLVAGERFAFPVELITEHDRWFDIVWIRSDDGSGLVLIVQKGGDLSLIAACRSALADRTAFP